MNDIINCFNTVETASQYPGSSNVKKALGSNMTDNHMIDMTDSLSSVSSIFYFPAQWLFGCHANCPSSVV